MSLTAPILAALVARRAELGLTMTEIGRRMGAEFGQVKTIERGRRKNIGLDELAEYARAVGMEITATVVVRE